MIGLRFEVYGLAIAAHTIDNVDDAMAERIHGLKEGTSLLDAKAARINVFREQLRDCTEEDLDVIE